MVQGAERSEVCQAAATKARRPPLLDRTTLPRARGASLPGRAPNLRAIEQMTEVCPWS